MIWPWVAAWYLLASAITVAAYWLDKRAAAKGRWRTREKTLHTLALAGGWPGALLAQRLLRHKTRKRGFQVVTWVIVLVHVAAWGWSSGNTAGGDARRAICLVMRGPRYAPPRRPGREPDMREHRAVARPMPL